MEAETNSEDLELSMLFGDHRNGSGALGEIERSSEDAGCCCSEAQQFFSILAF